MTHSERLMRDLFEASQIADDYVDNDKPMLTLGEDMARLLELCLVQIPLNPFYQQHGALIAPLIVTALASWVTSNKLKLSSDPDLQAWGWAMRDQLEQVQTMIGYIEGGMDQAIRENERTAIQYRTDADRESIEDWVKSGGGEK